MQVWCGVVVDDDQKCSRDPKHWMFAPICSFYLATPKFTDDVVQKTFGSAASAIPVMAPKPLPRDLRQLQTIILAAPVAVVSSCA